MKTIYAIYQLISLIDRLQPGELEKEPLLAIRFMLLYQNEKPTQFEAEQWIYEYKNNPNSSIKSDILADTEFTILKVYK